MSFLWPNTTTATPRIPFTCRLLVTKTVIIIVTLKIIDIYSYECLLILPPRSARMYLAKNSDLDLWVFISSYTDFQFSLHYDYLILESNFPVL